MAPTSRNRRTPRTPRMSEQLVKWVQSREEKQPAFKAPMDLLDWSCPLPTLMGLAIKNSPTGYCTHNQIYSFILHHFPKFRYTAEENWRNSVRKQISHAKFRKEEGLTTKANRFFLADPEQFENVFNLKNFKKSAQNDPRGPEFFERMIKGQIGLPRQLFYTVVALGSPCFAGPENSAVFYYLLSIGHIIKKDESIFREYYQPTPSIIECRFVEQEIPWTQRAYENPLEYPEFCRALSPRERPMKLGSEQIARFHDNIKIYFQLQCSYWYQGIPSWTTPLHQDVWRFVLEGPNQHVTFCPRGKEIPGSLYDQKVGEETVDQQISEDVPVEQPADVENLVVQEDHHDQEQLEMNGEEVSEAEEPLENPAVVCLEYREREEHQNEIVCEDVVVVEDNQEVYWDNQENVYVVIPEVAYQVVYVDQIEQNNEQHQKQMAQQAMAQMDEARSDQDVWNCFFKSSTNYRSPI